MTVDPTPTRSNFPAHRGLWWLVGVTATLLLVLRGIQWNRGRHSLPDVLVPCGMILLSAGNILRPSSPQRMALWLGVMVLIVALVLKFAF